MFEMPRVLQPEHGDQPDRRQQLERKDFAHAEKQNDQQQPQTKYRRRICQRQPHHHHDQQQKRQRRGERGKLNREICRVGDVAEQVWRACSRRNQTPARPTYGNEKENREAGEYEAAPSATQ